MLPVILGHLPAGSSVKQIKHYLQLHESNRFCQYDFGKDNQRIYGRSTPPDYALQLITAPVGLYYGQNDFLAAVEDVHRLAKRLPNVVVNHMYSNKKYNHIDMVWGISSRRIAQPKLLQVMQLWESGGPLNATRAGKVSPDADVESTPNVETVDEEEQQEDREAMENYVK